MEFSNNNLFYVTALLIFDDFKLFSAITATKETWIPYFFLLLSQNYSIKNVMPVVECIIVCKDIFYFGIHYKEQICWIRQEDLETLRRIHLLPEESRVMTEKRGWETTIILEGCCVLNTGTAVNHPPVRLNSSSTSPSNYFYSRTPWKMAPFYLESNGTTEARQIEFLFFPTSFKKYLSGWIINYICLRMFCCFFSLDL